LATLAARYPSLRLAVDDEHRVVRGAFNIEHDGKFLGGFEIEVLLHKTDVLGLPRVIEVGGRIPRLLERHINPGDGSACLYLPEDLLVRCKERFGIVTFLDGPVRNFFLGQLGVESGEPFPLGEWAHGADGVKQMLKDLIGFDDIGTCMTFLELLGGKVIKGHWVCPCGSRRALRACHVGLVRRLRHELPLTTRRFLLTRVREHFPTKSPQKSNGRRPVLASGYAATEH
jgi:hypothetical protein